MSKCNYCGVEMSSGGNMRDHVRSHTNEKPFACEHCGKTFRSNNNLKGHMVVHSDDRPYVCDICGFAFKQKGLMKIHRTRHDPESSRYTCHICGKHFFSSTEVKKHLPTHTGEKNYECQVCHKKFSQDSALARHRFIHTDSKPHKCDICGTSFVRKEHFRRHNIKFHSDGNDKVEDDSSQPSEYVVELQDEAADAADNLLEGQNTVYIQLDGGSYQVPYIEDDKGASILYESMEIPVQQGEIIIITNSDETKQSIEYATI